MSKNNNITTTTTSGRTGGRLVKFGLTATIAAGGLGIGAGSAAALDQYGSTPALARMACALLQGTFSQSTIEHFDGSDTRYQFSTHCTFTDSFGDVFQVNCSAFGQHWVDRLRFEAGDLPMRCTVDSFSTTVPEPPPNTTTGQPTGELAPDAGSGDPTRLDPAGPTTADEPVGEPAGSDLEVSTSPQLSDVELGVGAEQPSAPSSVDLEVSTSSQLSDVELGVGAEQPSAPGTHAEIGVQELIEKKAQEGPVRSATVGVATG